MSLVKRVVEFFLHLFWFVVAASIMTYNHLCFYGWKEFWRRF